MSEEWRWNQVNPQDGMTPDQEEGVRKAETNPEGESTNEKKNDSLFLPPEDEVQNTEYSETTAETYHESRHSDWKRGQESARSDAESEENWNRPAYSRYQFTDDILEKTDKKKKKKGTGRKILKTAAFAVLFGAVAGGTMFGVNKAANYFWGEDPEEVKQVANVQMQQSSVSGQQTSTDGSVYSVSDVAKNCMPSVVSITNASVTTVKNYFGGTQEYQSESSGSGIIVGQNDTELLIATNNHVVDGAETLTVAFCDQSVYEAQTKGTASDADLAVIAVKLSDMSAESLEAIRIIQIGNSDDLEVGEQVVAIGNALGYGQSVTSGWVSALNREVEDEDGNTVDNLIQTDAAINPGNSGGALLNMRGELIGINSAKTAATNVEGMGYAISIAKAEPILNELMNMKTRYKVSEDQASYMGISCYTVDASVTQMYGIPTGAFMDSVEEDGPAARAGIKKGDVIVKFDGQSISSSTKLVDLLQYYAAGETVDLVVARAEGGEYKEITLTITLGKKN